MIRTISKVGLLAGAMAAYGIGALTAKAQDNMGPGSQQPIYRHMRVSDDQGIRVMVNRQVVDFNGPGPIMVGDHVFVPVRGVFEQMSGYVQWHADDQVIHGFRPGGHEFRIQIGSNSATVNGVDETLDTPPILRDGTTYVPLRFASEALGAHVRWHPDTNTVAIWTNGDDND